MKGLIVVALIVAVAAGAYLYNQNPKPDANKMDATSMMKEEATPAQDSSSMMPEFMAPTDATKYSLDLATSKISWNAKKTLVDSKHNGTIAFKSGEVYELKDGSLKGKLMVDMASITDLDLTDATMKSKLEGHLKSADFFDVATHPESVMIFDATRNTDGTYKATGTLTIKGKTNPVEVTFSTKTTDDKTVTGTADFEFNRAKYDVKFGSGEFFKDLGDKIIDDIIKLNVEITATK